MRNLNNKLQHLDHQQLRDILSNMLDTYCIPSFDSMSKHDIDLLMFDSMVRMEVISDNPTIYDVMRDLKVTRSKARTLIYEFQLRKVQNEEQLREQNKRQIHIRLVELGVKPDTSLKKILPHLMKGVAKTMAIAAMGKVGEDIADDYI